MRTHQTPQNGLCRSRISLRSFYALDVRQFFSPPICAKVLLIRSGRSFALPIAQLNIQQPGKSLPKQFNRKFNSEHIKEQKFTEFEWLKQGDLLVRDYIYHFNRLSQFAEELMDTDEKKKKRFIKGLRVILHREVTSQHPATFDDAVE